MELSNKLAILDTALPLKAYTKEKLKEVIYKEFIVWLSALLSLTDEVSAQRLFTAIPAIEKHCWSMGFAEIKKMFSMYADNELSISPIPNYFDRILFGKIVSAYKQQKVKQIKVIEPIVISDQDKRLNEILSAAICFDYYIQNGYLNDTSLYLYKVLLDKFKFSQKEIDVMIEKSKELEKPVHEQRAYYKGMCLRRYFDRLHAKGQQLKDVI